jgi:NAD(P)-dependent dehydrogenase (short-subunit alcohol dehydrogenase family)
VIKKELAIELNSNNENRIIVFAIHPGSAMTDMNQKGKVKPKAAVNTIISSVEKLEKSDSGNFFDANGDPYPL